MALGPNNRKSSLRQDIILTITSEIDEQITNTMEDETVLCYCRDYDLNRNEIKRIKYIYTNAGWDTVNYGTSFERGERPGLARWELSTNKD